MLLALQELTAADMGPLTAYTPSWVTTGTAPSVGNGSIAGGYASFNDLVHFYIALKIGTTTTFGTGNWAFTLPFNATLPSPMDYNWTGQAVNAGVSAFAINGTFGAPNFAFAVTGSPLASLTSASPFAWGDQDRLFLSGAYWRA